MNEKRSVTVDRRKNYVPFAHEERRKVVRRTSGWSSVEQRWIDGSKWLNVPGYERYRFTLDGRVESICSGEWKPIKLRRDTDGYLFFTAHGEKRKYIRIHMLVYSYLHGVRGTLRQPICHGPVPDCNLPDNLRIGTMSSNVRDTHRDGTTTAKLTDAQVSYIRTCDISTTELAKEFGVSQVTIHDARTGRKYAHVQTPPRPAKRIKAGLSDAQVSRIMALTGTIAQSEIAGIVGCTRQAVSNYQAQFDKSPPIEGVLHQLKKA